MIESRWPPDAPYNLGSTPILSQLFGALSASRDTMGTRRFDSALCTVTFQVYAYAFKVRPWSTVMYAHGKSKYHEID